MKTKMGSLSDTNVKWTFKIVSFYQFPVLLQLSCKTFFHYSKTPTELTKSFCLVFVTVFDLRYWCPLQHLRGNSQCQMNFM